MALLVDALLMEVLKACSQANPLYPADFTAHSGLDRNLLDEALDHLRLRGLVRFTDWVSGKGQGYAVTSQGTMVLQNPNLLRKAQIQAPSPPPAPGFEHDERPWARGDAVRDALLTPTPPFVTMILLAINIAVFLTELVPAVHNDLRLPERGYLFPLQVLVGKEWWRLLSYAFFHGGWLHLAMNMYALYAVGRLLERMWGHFRFLYLYLVGALVGGCAVVAMATDPRIPTVGASGALCGLITSLGVWFLLNRHALPPQMVSSMMSNVFTNIFLIVIISMMPNVSWQCHLGGAIGGAVVSIPLNYQRFGRSWQKLLGLLGALAVPVVAVVAMLDYTEGSLGERQKIERDLNPIFWAAEIKAITAYNEQVLPLLKNWDAPDNGQWTKARKVFEDVIRQLQATFQLLSKAGPYRDAKLEKTVRNAQVYLEKWSEFYSEFVKICDQPPPWPAQSKQSLIDELEVVEVARRPLVRSVILQSAMKN
jgi:membrane associated rhomboid family serine protease